MTDEEQEFHNFFKLVENLAMAVSDLTQKVYSMEDEIKDLKANNLKFIPALSDTIN